MGPGPDFLRSHSLGRFADRTAVQSTDEAAREPVLRLKTVCNPDPALFGERTEKRVLVTARA